MARWCYFCLLETFIFPALLLWFNLKRFFLPLLIVFSHASKRSVEIFRCCRKKWTLLLFMEWNLLNFIINNDVLIARAFIAFLLFFVFLLFFLFFASRLVSFRFICTGVDDEVLDDAVFHVLFLFFYHHYLACTRVEWFLGGHWGCQLLLVWS